MTKKAPARICVVRHGFYPSDPRVLKETRALVEHGFEVHVICISKDQQPLRETVDGVRVYRLPHGHRRGSRLRYVMEYGLSMAGMSLVLSILHLRYRYRAVQVNTLPDTLVFAAWLPRLLGAKVYLDLHEPTPELYRTKYGDRVSARVLRLHAWLEQAAIRFAHESFTVNDTIRQRFIERGADPGHLHVVRNVPSAKFTPRSKRPDPQHFTLITHGTLQPRYGHDVILQAMPTLQKRIPNLRLIIIGDGETRPQLERLAREYQCENIVDFRGYIPHAVMPELLAQADVGLVPLQPGPFSELCQPNKLFEYIALKVPVVAARLPAMEESFDDHCVTYFTPGDPESLADAVCRLHEDPEQARQMTEQAYEAFIPLQWSNVGPLYAALYDPVLNPARSS